MTHLMIDGKVVGSQQILQLVKTFLVLVFLLGGWAFLGSIMPFVLNVWMWSERVK